MVDFIHKSPKFVGVDCNHTTPRGVHIRFSSSTDTILRIAADAAVCRPTPQLLSQDSLWTYKVCFTRDVLFLIHNNDPWTTDNPRVIHELVYRSLEAIVMNIVIEPYLLPEGLTAPALPFSCNCSTMSV